ncbi:MAG: APC family permease [Bifidobacteriaceae bacterium]|jgi:amino acid transporter|nr:APC family permease [Bifidobacteriaceae bacterium]
MTSPATAAPAKQFRMFDMIFFAVTAMLLLSQLGLTATIGPTAVFWTVVVIILFFVPYALVTAELGSTYPDSGGIYAWVVRAFGNRWGSRVSWWYWLNVALWVPSVYLLFSETLSALFFDGGLNYWVQVAITLALVWIGCWINLRGLKSGGTLVSTTGAIITMAVIVILAVGGGIYAANHGSATEWSLSAIVPSNSDALPVMALALSVIVYNFLGFELMSSASTQMRNPKRDVPKAIVIAGAMIGGFYLLATVGMQLVIPADEISETSGVIDVITLIMGDSAVGKGVAAALGIGALFCFFACLIPWTIGANIAAQESGQWGDLPRIFSLTHKKRDTPLGAAVLLAVVSTVVTLLYAVFSEYVGGEISELFITLFYFSSVIFLLPYIVMMLAFHKLRRTDPGRERPYRIPGGKGFTAVITLVPTVILAAAAFFFIIDPFSEDVGEYFRTWTLPILVGVVIAVIIQEIFCAKSRTWIRQRAVERGEDPDHPVSPFLDAGGAPEADAAPPAPVIAQ